VAYNGKDAISKAAENPHLNLILMDIDLGNGMDGTELPKSYLKIAKYLSFFFLITQKKKLLIRLKKLNLMDLFLKTAAKQF